MTDSNPTSPKLAHGDRGHALCSASGAERWMNCVGSVALCKTLPTPPSSIYAEEGTMAHELAEVHLNRWLKGEVICEIDEKHTPEMIQNVMFYVGYVKEKAKEFDVTPTIRIETKLTLNHDLTMWGTADIAMTGLMAGKRHGKIIDLKYGKGRVILKDNPQLAYYAAALTKTSKHILDSVEVAIVQPRLDKPISAITYTKAELDIWYNTLISKAEKAIWAVIDKNKQEFTKGTWCKWCNAKKICPEFNTLPADGAGLEFL